MSALGKRKGDELDREAERFDEERRKRRALSIEPIFTQPTGLSFVSVDGDRFHVPKDILTNSM